MGINIMEIEPHKVSRDLSGYIIYLYGEGKTGKTTLATQAGGALLLAFEKGYNALPGIYPVDITSWKDVRDIKKQLGTDAAKARYKSIIFDTIDIAGAMCEKWICAQAGVDNVADVADFGGGWVKLKREFENTVREITQMGYAVYFISHDKDKEFKRKDGTKYNQIIPTCPTSFNNIAKNAADVYAFAEKYTDESGQARVRLILRSIDNSIDTGCRFKYIQPTCEMSYEALKQAILDAIDKEAEIMGGQFVTDEREEVKSNTFYDFEGLINEFNEITMNMMEEDPAYYQPRIIDLVTRVLGPGKKVNEASIQQVELIAEIVESLKDMKKK